MRLLSIILFLCAISLGGESCKVILEDRLRGIGAKITQTSYIVEDRNHSDFGGSAVLDPSGTLRIAFNTATSDGASSPITPKEWIPRMVDYIRESNPRKVRRIEYTLAKNETVDDAGNFQTENPALDKFNRDCSNFYRTRDANYIRDFDFPAETLEAKAVESAGDKMDGADSLTQFGKARIKDKLGNLGKVVRVTLVFGKD